MLDFRTLTESKADPYPPRPIAIQGFLRVGDLAIITGGWDTFKSYMALEMAWSLATGVKFLQWYPILQKMRVGIVQVEIDPGAYEDRLMAYPDTDNLLTCSDLTFRFDRLGELAVAVAELQLDTVVLDPLGPMWPERAPTGEPFSENEKLHVTAVLRELKAMDCTVIMVHHDPKPSANMKGRASGSAALLNDPDTRILLDRAGNKVRMEVKSRLQQSVGAVECTFLPVRRLVALPAGKVYNENGGDIT